MKVAVSIPDDLFREAERVSRRLGLPRSRFYARAIEAYVRSHSNDKVTESLNAVLARVGEEPEPGWENPSLDVLRREKR